MLSYNRSATSGIENRESRIKGLHNQSFQLSDPQQCEPLSLCPFCRKEAPQLPYTLNKYEKETIILYNQSNDRVNITTYDPVLRRKLTDYAAKHPDFCKRLDKDKYPDYVEYEIDKDRLSIRFLTPYSEERRKAAAEQVKRLNQPAIKAEGID